MSSSIKAIVKILIASSWELSKRTIILPELLPEITLFRFRRLLLEIY